MKKLGDAAALRILLVDDDVEVREVVTAMLEAVGFAIRGADGEEGLGSSSATASIRRPDWTLPGIAGSSLPRRARALDKAARALSHRERGTRDVVEAFAAERRHVVKPFRGPSSARSIFASCAERPAMTDDASLAPGRR